MKCLNKYLQKFHLNYKFGLNEAKTSKLYKDAFGECLATFILIFIGIGAAIEWKHHSTFPMQVGLAMGIIVSTVIEIFGHVSGGLANPAVTVSFISSGQMSLIRGIVYIIAQLLGGILAVLVFELNFSEGQTLGDTILNPEVHVVTAFGIEFVRTGLYVLTWQAYWDPFRAETKPAAASSIGFTYSACHGFGYMFFGASVNPAKSFSFAIIMNNYPNHWIFWPAPIGAGLVCGLFYKILLMPYPAHVSKEAKENIS